MDKEKLIEEIRNIAYKIEELHYASGMEWKKLGEMEDELQELVCEIRGGHMFEFDMCGCWQHKYCVQCGESQYPEVASKDLAQIREEMGKMTEEEYNKQKQ